MSLGRFKRSNELKIDGNCLKYKLVHLLNIVVADGIGTIPLLVTDSLSNQLFYLSASTFSFLVLRRFFCCSVIAS